MARTGDPIGKHLEGHTAQVLSVAFSHDSTYIASGSMDNTIRIWDARTGTAIGEPLEGHIGYVWSVAFSPDSTRIFSGSQDGTIRVWQTPQNSPSFDLGTGELVSIP
jgi:WD40 repeat protein